VLRRHDYIEAAPGPDKLAAPLQTFGGIQERAPADTEFLLCLTRRKDTPARSK
jgi:hypothetical protein